MGKNAPHIIVIPLAKFAQGPLKKIAKNVKKTIFS